MTYAQRVAAEQARVQKEALPYLQALERTSALNEAARLRKAQTETTGILSGQLTEAQARAAGLWVDPEPVVNVVHVQDTIYDDPLHAQKDYAVAKTDWSSLGVKANDRYAQEKTFTRADRSDKENAGRTGSKKGQKKASGKKAKKPQSKSSKG